MRDTSAPARSHLLLLVVALLASAGCQKATSTQTTERDAGAPPGLVVDNECSLAHGTLSAFVAVPIVFATGAPDGHMLFDVHCELGQKPIECHGTRVRLDDYAHGHVSRAKSAPTTMKLTATQRDDNVVVVEDGSGSVVEWRLTIDAARGHVRAEPHLYGPAAGETKCGAPPGAPSTTLAR